MSTREWFYGLIIGGIVLSGTRAVSGLDEPSQAKAKDADARNATVDSKLDRIVSLKFEKVPLDEVLHSINKVTKTPADDGLFFVVDPNGLKAAAMTVDAKITYAAEERETLRDTLTYMLGANRLKYTIKDGVIHINVTDNGRVLLDPRKQTRAVLAKLQEQIPLHFKDAPLEDVIKFIKQSTKGPNDSGIPIYVDPVGLQEAGNTMSTPVSIDSNEKEPLWACLVRLLKPIGLTYQVKDGLLLISSKQKAGKPD